jgi:predicted Rossmann fold nucleotide-binding protein DprA/Smf involved in DNA uptake
VTRTQDVLEALGLEANAAVSAEVPDGEVAQALLSVLVERVATADELVRATGLDAGSVAAALVELELAGRVSGDEGAYRSTIPR